LEVFISNLNKSVICRKTINIFSLNTQHHTNGSLICFLLNDEDDDDAKDNHVETTLQ